MYRGQKPVIDCAKLGQRGRRSVKGRGEDRNQLKYALLSDPLYTTLERTGEEIIW